MADDGLKLGNIGRLNRLDQDLSNGEAVPLQVPTSELAPRLLAGDMAAVQRVDRDDLAAGDLVLCRYGEQVAFRVIQRIVHERGNLSFEIASGLGMVERIGPARVLGKVTEIQRGGKTIVMGSPVLHALRRLASRLKPDRDKNRAVQGGPVQYSIPHRDDLVRDLAPGKEKLQGPERRPGPRA